MFRALLGCMVVLAVVMVWDSFTFALLIVSNRGPAPWMGMVYALAAMLLKVLVFLFILIHYVSLIPFYLAGWL